MKNFSELNLQTTKDKLVNDFASKSGLDKNFCNKLYEDFNIQFAGDNHSIAEKFKSLLKSNINTSYDIIGQFLDILNGEKPENMTKLVNDFIDTCCKDSDEYSYYKVILTVLYLKDYVNFQKLSQTIGDVKNLSIPAIRKLNESYGIDSRASKEGSVPKIIGVNDGCSIKEDIEFYGSLKEKLARNNKRWGYNYHLDNVYKAIVDYLNKEIEYLTTKDNITTANQDFEGTLIEQLLHGELNVMYRDINTLRPLIVDIQTLVFDMMCLVMGFIKQNQIYLPYLNRKEFDDVLQVFKNLYGKISSSRKTSLLLIPYQKNKKDNDINGIITIWEDIMIDYSKYDIYTQPIKIVAAVDALYIIKSCTSEFNLTIRPAMNLFFTKAMNVIGKIEHIIYESKKFNKFKNGY